MIAVAVAFALLHGSLDEQIALFNRLVEQSPDHPRHRLRRGESFRLHGEEHRGNPETAARDWERAEADFAHALALDPQFHAVRLARGRLRLVAERPAAALEDLDVFCKAEPGHAAGHLYRGRALATLGRRAEAVDAFTRSIEHAPSPAPEIFLERAEASRSQGREEEALRGLEEGLDRLGPLVTLDLAALDLETSLGRTEAALARIARRLERPGRKEEWQFRRAQLLRSAGRRDDARSSAEAALGSIDGLPASRRHAPATLELEARLRSFLSEIR